MNENLEEQLNKLGNPKPVNENFKMNLKKRLLNEYGYKLENEKLRSYMDGNRQKRQGFFGLFGRLGVAGAMSFVLLLFLGTGVMAYYSIPTVKETVDKAVGVYPTGNVDIKTTPDNAKLYINGEYFGDSPAKLEFQEGNYSIKIEKEGYKTVFNSFEIVKKQTTEVYIELESLTPEDPYKGWLTYNNEKYSFGFRYDPEWSISENESETFNVQLGTQEFNAEITYLNQNQELELKEQNSDFNVSACGKQLNINIEYLSDTERSNEAEIKVNKFLDSIWLNCPTDEYELPVSNALNRFMWQIENSVYSVDYANTDLKDYKVTDDMHLNSVSPNGRWALFYGDGGIWLMDTLGENKLNLISPGKSEDGVYVNLSLEGSGWAPNSMYFVYSKDIYDVSDCQSDCEGPGMQIDESPAGEKAGLYLFDLASGKSTYLKDSQKEFITNWSKDSQDIYVYLDLEKRFVLREYKFSDLDNYIDYEFEDGDKYFSYQYDVYSKDKLVIRYGTLENTKVALATLTDGKILIEKNIMDGVGWTDSQFPKFTDDGNFIVFNSNKYYSIEDNKLYTYTMKFDFNMVYPIGNGIVIVVYSRDNYNYEVPATMAVINLTNNTVETLILDKIESENLILPQMR